MTTPSHWSARWFGTFAVVALAVMTLPGGAAAETDVSGGVDLKFGPYQPAIDAEFGDQQRPFTDIFGNSPRVLGQLTAEYYLWQEHGSFGVGLTTGYTSFGGSSIVEGGSSDGGDGNGGDGQNGESNEDLSLEETTKFEVLPLGAIVSYRWDYLVERFEIPFAARVEAGFDYYMWRVTDGSGGVATVDGEKARGGTPGFHGAGRLEFHLDWLDPQNAAAMDVSWGINNTYFFAEYLASSVRDTSGRGFDLSDNSWRLGLAFEF